MSIAAVGYGAVGTGMTTLAIIPGGLGKGLVSAGTTLLGVSAWLTAQGEFYKRASRGYQLLEQQQLSLDEVKKNATDGGISFNEALVAATVKSETTEEAVNEETVKEATEDKAIKKEESFEAAVDKVLDEDESNGVGAKTTDITVIDEDKGVVAPVSNSAAINAAAVMV